jgi:hypothetical protein
MTRNLLPSAVLLLAFFTLATRVFANDLVLKLPAGTGLG